MKFSFLTFLIFTATFTLAQAPQGINYQAVLRDNLGNTLFNQLVGIRINIRSGSINGTIVYAESHNTNSNANGVVNLIVGQGTPIQNTFPNIQWGNGSTYFAEILADISGGTNYQTIGIQQLMSVPYALYAEKGGSFTENGNHIYNNNVGNVGIGVNLPNANLHVQGDFRLSNSNSNYVQFEVPVSSNQATIYELPSSVGNSGEVLTTDGVGQLSWTPFVTSNNNNCMTNRVTFPASGTYLWVVPAGVTKIKFRMWSAGGHGSSSGGGGGGGGGYAEGFLDVNTGNTINIKVPIATAARDTAIISYNSLYAYLLGGATGGWGEGGKLVGSNIPNILCFEGEDGELPEITEISATSYVKQFGNGGSSPGLNNGGKAGVKNRWSGGNNDDPASKGGFPGGGGGGGDSSSNVNLGSGGLIIFEY